MFGKHCAIWILVIGSCAGLMSCSSHALYEAQETVATADSLWHNGQSFSDSAQLAQAYRTLHRRRNMYPGILAKIHEDSRCSISDIYNALNADVYSLEALEHFLVQEGIDNNIIHYAYETYHGWGN